MGKRYLLLLFLIVGSISGRYVDYRPTGLIERGPSPPPSVQVQVLDCNDKLLCPFGWICDGGVQKDKFCRKSVLEIGGKCGFPWLKCGEFLVCQWVPTSPAKICMPADGEEI